VERVVNPGARPMRRVLEHGRVIALGSPTYSQYDNEIHFLKGA